MTGDRIQIPCLDVKAIDGKRIYKYQQWLDRFKQYTKRKYNIDIGLLIKEGTFTETEWNLREKHTTTLSLGIGTQCNTLNNTFRIPNRLKLKLTTN